MKRLLLLALCALPLSAQVTLTAARRITTAASAPTTCSVGDVYFKTAATVGAYECLTANVWTLIATGTVPTIPSVTNLLSGDGAGNASDSGIAPGVVVKASSPGAGLAHFAGATQTVTSSAVVNADISGLLGLSHGALNLDLTATGGTNFFLRQNSAGGQPDVVQVNFTALAGSAACAQQPALTGDTTTSAGSCATTTTKLNGTSFAGTSGNVVSFGAANIPTDAGFLASNVVRKDAANTGAAAMTLDLSAASGTAGFKAPVAAGAAPTANGAVSYDSTANGYVGGVNGVTNYFPIATKLLTFTGATAARSIALPVDAAFTIARQDAAQTFTGVQTFASPVFTGTVTSAAYTGSGTFTNNGSYAGSAIVPTSVGGSGIASGTAGAKAVTFGASDAHQVQVTTNNSVATFSLGIDVSNAGANNAYWNDNLTGSRIFGDGLQHWVVGTSVSAGSVSNSAVWTVAGISAATNKVFFTGLTASAGLQTGVLCLSSGSEVINDSVACLASSARFKHNIQPLRTGLEAVMAMRPVSFRYNETGNIDFDKGRSAERVGFIAEEAARIDPRLVGFDNQGLVRSFAYDNYTAVLTKAIQELKAELDALKMSRLQNF